MPRPIPAAQFVRECFEYSPDTGELVWRRRPLHHFKSPRGEWQWNARYAGTVAGSTHSGGYVQVVVNKKKLFAHRIAWVFISGSWPTDEIDHINGDKSDNRKDNLRAATHSENGRNKKISSRNTSGAKGVHWFDRTQKWSAHLNIGGRQTTLGYFDTIAEAAESVRAAREIHHGAFANHG